MNQITTTKQSALAVMANQLSVEPEKLLNTLKNTVFKGASNDELLALVVVSNTYQLNPLLKELYAFPAKGGGIVPVVSIDGWISMVNRQAGLDGIEFEMSPDGEECTCRIYIKDRSRPVTVTEYKSECFRGTEPWKTMPKRMLRHKALIQAARIAFGFSGICDEDEATRIKAANAFVVESKPVFVPKEQAGAQEPAPAIEEPKATAEQPEPEKSAIAILRQNLADSAIPEKAFIDHVRKTFNAKNLRTIGDMTEEQADEILGVFDEIVEEMK
jgi:phage recombination protein Bet